MINEAQLLHRLTCERHGEERKAVIASDRLGGARQAQERPHEVMPPRNEVIFKKFSTNEIF